MTAHGTAARSDPATRVGVMGFEIDPVTGRQTFVGSDEAGPFGYSAEQWAGPDFLASVIHPDDRSRVVGQLATHLATPGRTLSLRYRLLTKDQRVVWIADRRVSPPTRTEPGAGVWIDVTDERDLVSTIDEVITAIDGRVGDAFFHRLAVALAATLEVRSVLVGAIGGPNRDRVTTIALAVDGAVSDQVTYSLIGAPCGEVVAGRPLVIADGARERHPVCSIVQHLDARGYVGVPVYGGASSPIGLLVAAHDRPLPDADRIAQVLEALAPRTGAELQRRRAEEERDSLQSQLVEAQKMEALGTLAGGIAHDFNNILMGILGNTEMALDCLETWHPATGNLAEIRRAAHRARDLVQRILTFGRKREPIRQALSMSTVIDDLVLLLRASLPSTIELVVEHGELPSLVHADGSQVHQVLMNLASNAAHAIGHRPGRITIRDAIVDLTPDHPRAGPSLPEGRYLKVTVADTGLGMDRETLARAFEPFFTTKAPGEGTGLGLAVAHGIMQEHGGAISATSTPGVGSDFVLYFPVFEGEPSADDGGDESLPIGAGQHLLLVDDEIAIVRVTHRMLERLGYRVTSFDSARAALAAFEAAPGSFRLVISDLTMPEVTGLDLAERVRQIDPAIPIVLTSGHPDLGGDGRLALVDQVLTKPYASATLAQTVHRLVVAPEASTAKP